MQGRNAYEYDAQGRLVLETVTGTENSVKYRINTAYGPDGRKASETRKDPRGLVILTSRYEYDEAGNRTAWRIYMGENDLVGATEYRYEGGFLTRITMRARENEYRGMIQIERDKKGREASRTNISVRGTTESYETYEYEGDLRVRETKTGVSGRVLLVIQYEYDAEGNLAKRVVKTDKGKVKEYTVYEYAKKGGGVPAM